jgi:hypothetical protein
MNGAAEGTLAFERPAGHLSPGTTQRQIESTALAAAAARRMEESRTRYILEQCMIGGRDFRAEISFEVERLDRIELYLHMPGDKAGWAGWTETGERQRKETAEMWAAEVFGNEMTVKPFVLDGQLITPFEVTWNTARHIAFPWGEIISGFDSKSGFAFVIIRYGTNDA